MCGIVGLVGQTAPLFGLEEMSECVAHRGPDGSGLWTDSEQGIALGHRRLAILDLSPAGAQPMGSASGRWVVVLNGEIYNFQQLRSRLQASWRGHSDTEVLVEALDAWGLPATLPQLGGMFAFAAYDRHQQVLWLVRDRMGEKPLYYGWTEAGFAFASELSALRCLGKTAPRVSPEALSLLLRFAYIPSPWSLLSNIYKLEPGCCLRLDLQQLPPAPPRPLQPGATLAGLRLERYWDLADVVASPGRLHPQEALAQLGDHLDRAVEQQLVADVPVGALLSGGIDSSLVVARMQRLCSQPVKTFTIGFEEREFDESPYARRVAAHLGTEHHELTVTAADALRLVPQLGSLYSEPLGDVSQIPTLLVCQLARQHVTVALSGDGGDELFGGYPHFWRGALLWNTWSRIPPVLRSLLQRLYPWLSSPSRAPFEKLRRKLWNSLRLLRHPQSFEDFHQRLIGRLADSGALLPGVPQEPLLQRPTPASCRGRRALGLMFRDSLSYLPDDVLCKVDRAAMAHGLETRVPMLDPQVIQAAWNLPDELRLSRGRGKIALRKLLAQHLPPELIERPKAGFSVPIGGWLRGPLRSWACDLLSPERLRRQNHLQAEAVERLWQQHLRGEAHEGVLWSLLMFQSWLETL